MLRHANHIPEFFDVVHTDEAGNVKRSWRDDDPLEILQAVDVEPGSIDHAIALHLMAAGYEDIIGPARDGGVIHIYPRGRIDLVPVPVEPVIELERYVDGTTSVRLGDVVYARYGRLDILAAWDHYVDDLTDDQRARLRTRAAEEWGLE